MRTQAARWVCRIVMVLAMAATGSSDAQNLLTNPNFATDLSGWSTDYLDGMFNPVIQLGGCSWDPANLIGAGTGCANCYADEENTWFSLHQCVPISGVDRLIAEAYHYQVCGTGGFGWPILKLMYYENGIFMDYVAECTADGGDCAVWNKSLCSGDPVPTGATSVCVVLHIWNTSFGGIVRAAFDGIKLMPVSIFSDGFESGTTAAWSSQVP